MTKRKSGEESVVEIDAMDVAEWEQDQHTPSAPSDALAALVKQTRSVPVVEPPKEAAPVRKTAAIQRAPAKAAAKSAPTKAPSQPKAEASKPVAKPEVAKPQPKAEAAKPQPKPEAAKPQPRVEAAKPQPTPSPVAKPQPKAEAAKPEPKPEPPKPKPEPPKPPPKAEVAKPVASPSPIAKPAPPLPDDDLAIPIAAPVAAIVSKDAITQPTEPVARPDNTRARLAEEGKRLTTEGALRASAPRSHKKLALIAGAAGAVVLIVVIAVAATGGNKSSSPSKTAHAGPISGAGHAGHGSAETEGDVTPSTSMQLEHARGGATAASPAGSATGSDQPTDRPDQPAAGSDTGSAAPPPPPVEKPRPARSSGTPVVLDYDEAKAPPKPPPETPAEEAEAIAKARASYAAGNQRLFAGDPAGAIHAYRESLNDYSGYVAAYRGLGLAYTQQGEKTRALQAFRTYVGLVPNARDVALIKKRIASLQIP